MHADSAGDDFSLDDDLARIDDLLPLWQRFGPEEAEERRVAARFQFLELVSESALKGAPNSAIERLLAVNLVVVQAAALNCLQRDPNSFGPEGHGYLRQGARLMERGLRLAGALSREQKSRCREAREAEAEAAEAAAHRRETPDPEPGRPKAEAASTRSGARAKDEPAARRRPWHSALDRAPHSEGPPSDGRAETTGPPGRAPPAEP